MKAHRTYRLFCVMLSLALFLTAVPLSFSIKPLIAEAASSSEIPVNPNASPEAIKLLKYLSDISGKGILTGQHDYLESTDEFNNKLQVTSGKFAALHGYELGAISGQSEGTAAWQRKNVVNSAINWNKNGGIVAMTFHANLPGTSYDWSNVKIGLTQANFDKYVTPGTTEYNNLIIELDKVAVSLKSLRDAGVPVLWRPYHEMNGGWFWWGKKNNFAALWNIMYDRYVNVHKLNNLLWVWSPNAPNAWADPYALTYPGADKVDILAADIYENDYKQSHHDSLLSLAAGKPIAIGENGEMPNIEKVLNTQNKWAFMMNWGKMLYEKNSTDTIKNFMNNSFTLTRDEYITGAIPSATPTPTITPIPTAKPALTTGYEIQLPVQNGLQGQYFSNKDLTGTPVLVRTDAGINYNWGLVSPPSVGVDYFSIRWTGKIKPLYTEIYNIYTASDDGIRVWVNGDVVIDSWMKQSGSERVGSIALEAGQLYDIKVEYYENEGNARVRLMWESQSQVKQTVPAGSLFVVESDLTLAKPTATPTPTPVPTATPTPTAVPTATPTPTAVPTATPAPTAVPTVMPVPTPAEALELSLEYANGLKGEYFSNIKLSGTPVLVRNDNVLDFNWRLLSPNALIGADFYSIRWTGKIKPLYSETYKIYTASDDGIRVWVNGESVIDSWIKQSGSERVGSIALEAGQLYDIKVEYYENQGDARVRLMWESLSQVKATVPNSALFIGKSAATLATPTAAPAATPAPTPASTPAPTPAPTPTPTPAPTPTPTPAPTPTPTPVAAAAPPAETENVEFVNANGLQGEYFNNIQLSGTPALVRNDNVLDFNWRLLSPNALIGNDFFSVRWTGKIKPLYSETYQIYTNSDDGIRVWIDGISVIDSWVKQSGTERQGTITLTAGQLHDIKVEYYENQGDARSRLLWESPSQLKGVVPTSALFLPNAS